MLSHLRTLFTARPIMPYNGPTLATAIAASQNLASTSSKDEAQFANGCFWGTEVSPPFASCPERPLERSSASPHGGRLDDDDDMNMRSRRQRRSQADKRLVHYSTCSGSISRTA